MMAFRLGTAWLLPLLITVSLHENCMGGWKLFWTVCHSELCMRSHCPAGREEEPLRKCRANKHKLIEQPPHMRPGRLA